MRERIKVTLHKIEEELYANLLNANSISVMGGMGSYSLFYYLLHQLTNEEKHENKFYESIDLLYEQLNDESYSKTYCNGLGGVAYLLNFYSKKRILHPNDVDDSLLFFDQVLLKWVKQLFREEHLNSANELTFIDFLHGALGVMYYLNERSTLNAQIKEETKLLFYQACDFIEQEVRLFIEDDQSKHKLNCGLAHGVGSYLMILSKYLENNPGDKKIIRTLELCVNALLDVTSKNPLSRSVFPSIVKDKKNIQWNTSSGWCYGDQTTTLSLYFAGKALGRSDLTAKAEELALLTLKRDSLESAARGSLTDAGFCHGLSGVAFLHKRWYQLTGKKEFHDMYLHFLNETLKLATFSDTPSGFKKYNANEGFIKDASLLTGSCGVGIVLMDYLLEENTIEWDRIFLLR